MWLKRVETNPQQVASEVYTLPWEAIGISFSGQRVLSEYIARHYYKLEISDLDAEVSGWC